jgi:hypothetical protein
MPQIEVFQCPSCGANLSYDGGPETSVTCQFCGTNVVIPAELRAKAAPPEPMPPLAASASAGQALPPDQAALLAMLGQIASHAASAHPDRAARLAAVMSALEQMAVYPGALGQASNINQAAMAAVGQLARSGQKMEAIKVYRLITGSGLREANDAVEAMAGGQGLGPQQYEPMPAPAPMPARGRRRARGAAGCGCFPILLVIAGFVALVGYVPYRLSGSYDVALSAARSNPQVVKALGEPVEADWWVWGTEMSCSGSCSAHYTIPIHGPRASGSIVVNATMRRGGNYINPADWTVRGTVTTGAGAAIDLAQRSTSLLPAPTQIPLATKAPPPPPTPPANLAATAEAMPNALQDWQRISPANSAAPFAGWPSGLQEDQAIAVTTTAQGKSYLLTVFPKHSSSYMNFFPQGAGPLTDFEATVDVAFNKGAAGNTYAYGLVFRRVKDDYGFFGLQNDGQYKVLLVKQTGIYQQVINKVTSVSLDPGMANVLEIRNVGADFVFLVNGVPVWGLTEDLPPGQVGLGVDVGTHGQTAQIQFSNFEVRVPGK